jgi:hypothetical protein
VGGVVAAVVAAGCEARSSDPVPSSQATTPPASEPEEDPDAALVDAVVAELTEALSVVAGAGLARRALRPELRAWQRLHEAHLDSLGASAATADPPRPTGTPAQLRAVVRRSEVALQRGLVEHALAARSGALAALLGTMSAAVAQQLVASRTGGAA